MQIKKTTLLVFAALTAFAAGQITPASANNDDQVVKVGKSINGISLGETLADVHQSTPLGLKKPASTIRQAAPPLGTSRQEIWGPAGSFGNTLGVFYLEPSQQQKKQAKKKHKKKPQPRVIYLQTGQGLWFIPHADIYTSPIIALASTVVDVGKVYACPFYKLDDNVVGGRDYNPTIGNAQSCELIQAQDAYFYFGFRSCPTSPADCPAPLAGFALSRYQLP
jgi:hypothetical protein